MTGTFHRVVLHGWSHVNPHVRNLQPGIHYYAPVTEMLPSSVNKRPVSSKRSKQTGPRRIVPRTSPNGVLSGNLSKHKWTTTGPLQPVTAPHTGANLTRQYAANNYSSCLIPT